MYGTVAVLRIKPGAEAEFERLGESFAATDTPPGMVAQYLYRSDTTPQEYLLAVVFTSKEAYRANATSPEQASRYGQLIQHLASAPQWHDGDIVFAFPATTA